MPNWITNIVTVKENVEEFKKNFFKEKGEVDFNAVIPCPQDLVDTESGSRQYIVNESSAWKRTDEQNSIQLQLETLYKDTYTQKEFVDLRMDETYNNPYFKMPREQWSEETTINVAKGYYNLQKYGYVDWYKFCIDKWGTKWNVDPAETFVDELQDGSLKITFDTAWSTPAEIWQELANKGLNFNVAYADEDLGNNFGILEVKDGQGFVEKFEGKTDDERFVLASLIKCSDETIMETIEEYEINMTEADVQMLYEEIKEYL